MSTCAHESFMSMLMKLPCARARGGVTRTTTLGQYASRIGTTCAVTVELVMAGHTRQVADYGIISILGIYTIQQGWEQHLK